MLNAAIAGLGLAYVPEDLAQPYLAKGQYQTGIRKSVPAISGLSSLLPQPTTVIGSV